MDLALIFRLIIFPLIAIMIVGSSFGAPMALDADMGLTFSRPVTVEDHVRLYFSDKPVLAEIAECESRFRHFDKKGNPLRGEQNPQDVGVMQINVFYHGEKAEELGLDLTSIGDNMAYARYLYEKEGTKPWKSSAACWNDSSPAKTSAISKK